MSKIDRDIDNFLAVIHDLARGECVWISRPAWIEFSNTNFCNLECVMCSHADGLPLQTMTRADTERILEEELHRSAKNRLQEWVQAGKGAQPPRYRTLATRGPAHARLFSVEVLVEGRVLGRGEGTTKREAQMSAARDALRHLGSEDAMMGGSSGEVHPTGPEE